MYLNFRIFAAALMITVLGSRQMFSPQSAHAQVGSQKIILLHHSSGGYIYAGDPSNSDPLKRGVVNWFNIYNSAHGTSFQPAERWFPCLSSCDNTPYDYWSRWVNHGCNSSSDYSTCTALASPCMDCWVNNYDVIIFKHCYYATSAMVADTGTPSVSSSVRSLENYKLQYRALRALLDSYPNKLFIMWTNIPRIMQSNDPAAAARVRQFRNWVTAEFLSEDGQPHNNIRLFDIYNMLVENDSSSSYYNYLKQMYQISSSDGHPNLLARGDISPVFSQFIVDSISSFFGGSDALAPAAPADLHVAP